MYDTILEEIRKSALTTAKNEFLTKFIQKYFLYHNGVFSIAEKKLRASLASNALRWAHDVGVPAVQALIVALVDDPNADTSGCADVVRRLSDLDILDSKGAPLSVGHTKGELLIFLDFLGYGAPTDEELAERKKAMVGDMVAQLQRAYDVSLLMLIVLVLRHAAVNEGLLKASGYVGTIDGC